MFKQLLFYLFLFSTLSGLSEIQVLVSIAPQKYLVEEIGKDQVKVQVIVPPGASSHTYEPTPKQIVAMHRGEIWFRLGENFETRLVKVLSGIQIIDQRKGIELMRDNCLLSKGGTDPHIWLSPKLLIIQSQQIAEILSQYDPIHEVFYKENLKDLEKKLHKIDEEIALLLATAPKIILVSHPAYGYFCRDYGLTQLTIEMEGREPTPYYLTDLIFKARQLEIRTVFLQKQQSVKGGIQVAKALGARICFLDPYVENVLSNLKVIAHAFSQ
ncbi:MAG: zinc ABC transporter substrate-binding protein [Chlamydiales bacterium]